MPLHDLHILPKIRDSWSFLYVEHCRIDQDAKTIAAHDATGVTPIPCASLALLMLGPGTQISHAAIRVLADSGCSVAWVGEEGVRCYAQGVGETRSAARTLYQARLWADSALRLVVVRRMYEMRFPEPADPASTLDQLRGLEGVRVKQRYAEASRQYGVAWHGRVFDRQHWEASDPVNKALSAANACLNGLCHAAILSAGYSAALGFIHTGKQLSFVYDIADLYKADLTVPAAFQAVADGESDLEGRVRRACRDLFHRERLLARIVQDMDRVLAVETPGEGEAVFGFDQEIAAPGGIWDAEQGEFAGGINYGDEGSRDES